MGVSLRKPVLLRATRRLGSYLFGDDMNAPVTLDSFAAAVAAILPDKERERFCSVSHVFSTHKGRRQEYWEIITEAYGYCEGETAEAALDELRDKVDVSRQLREYAEQSDCAAAGKGLLVESMRMMAGVKPVLV
jgi:hypothetical protein